MTELQLAWEAFRQRYLTASRIALLISVSLVPVGALALASAGVWRIPVTASSIVLVATLSAGPLGAIPLVPRVVRRGSAGPSCRRHLATVAASLLGAIALAWRAVRRHRFSVGCTTLLVTLSASLLGVSVPLALLLWALASVLGLQAWLTLEPLALEWLGCRKPSRLERERLEQALGSDPVDVLLVDAAEPWLGRGVRSLVVSRALLDLLEDRALAGLLAQARRQVRTASLPGQLVVWLGNLPLLGAWYFSRYLVQLGQVLAIAVGVSLVVPMVIWPGGFTRWTGRLFGAAVVGLFGSALLSGGLSAAGLGLLLAWALVPGVQTILNWETRRAEIAADDATLEAGLGWELVEALETLAWADSLPPPAAPLGWLCRLATPLTDRADRLWRKLQQA